jgi:diguanylate cyclase (GGDEF)-like protein
MREFHSTMTIAAAMGAGETGAALTVAAEPAAFDGSAVEIGLAAPLSILAKVAAIICVAGFAVMLGAPAMAPASVAGPEAILAAILPALLLALISAPLVLLWVVRPNVAAFRATVERLTGLNRMLLLEVGERIATEEKLRAHEQELELQIQEIDYVKQLVEAQAADAVGLAEDLAMQRQAMEESERRNEYLANHDVLTGLPNRRHFEQRLKQSTENAQTKNDAVTLIFVDLDNFKTVNDTLGHPRGDEILVQVADQLRTSVRDCDFVARLGGDEFAVVLNHPVQPGNAKLLEFAERIRTALAISVEGPHGVIPVSAALGIASFPAEAPDEQLLLKCADRAMYAAKAQGSNCVVFHRELEPAAAK